ncbi:MAG: GNAT family N-acetyltransferase [Candidatus Aenigmarchaeota archaeon]|nr:GNAT family N-acetyltransferase [Candidatus Aenigmarchaeota archaeon]
MPMIEIRKAKAKDIPAVVELAMDLVRYHKFDSYLDPSKNVRSAYAKYFRQSIRSRKKLLLVAETDGRIMGFVLGEILKMPPIFKIRTAGYVRDMLVAERFRRRGVGKLLLKSLFKWFKGKGIKHVELHVHIMNDIGKKAWETYGFRTFLLKQRIKLK